MAEVHVVEKPAEKSSKKSVRISATPVDAQSNPAQNENESEKSESPAVTTPDNSRPSGRRGTVRLTRQFRRSVSVRMQELRRRLQLNKLWVSVLRSLIVSLTLLVLLLLLTFLVGLLFFVVNSQGSTDSVRYRKLKALDDEYRRTLHEVMNMSKTTKVFSNATLTRKLIRLRQLGQNHAYKNVMYNLAQHELRPSLRESMHYAVCLVTLIGYGDIVGASELQYFCASLCMLIVVPVWFMYHHQLYHLFYFLQLYCHRRWIKPESRSNSTMTVLWAIRIRNASMYKRSRFYLSNLCLMLLLFPICLVVFVIVERQLSFEDQFWLTVQSIFHIGLGDSNMKLSQYWPVTFCMISVCFLIYFQCFSFILPHYPALRLSRIIRSDFNRVGF